MSEERCLRAERTSVRKASAKQIDPAFELLQQDRDEEIKMPQRAECRCFKKNCCRTSPRVLVLLVSIAILSLVLNFVLLLKSPAAKQQLGCSLVSPPQCGLPCPRYWIGYEGKCYYFSREKRDWVSSKHYCSSHNASLARIDKEEMDFVMRLKGKNIHWIGLRRILRKDWTWADGENATMEVNGGGGDCAFLDNTGKAVASGCHTKLPWICSKPAACTTKDVTDI